VQLLSESPEDEAFQSFRKEVEVAMAEKDDLL